MKKILLVGIISIAHFCAYGQKVKIIDLIELISTDIDNCDTWALKKGFVAVSDENSQDQKCDYFFVYSLKVDPTNDLAFYKCDYGKGTRNVVFRTRLESDYLAFKEEVKSLGFVYKEIVSVDKGKIIFYSLLDAGVNYELTLSTTIYSDFNLYEVAISIIP